MSKNQLPLETIFADALQIEAVKISDDLTYSSIPEWDSIAHMALVAAIEDHYSILLDTNDILDMSSVAQVKTILRKHGVSLEQ